MDAPYQAAPDVHVLPTNLPIPGVGVLPINAYVLGAEELDRAIALLEKLPEIHRQSWPRTNPPTWAETEEAYRRGEFQDRFRHARASSRRRRGSSVRQRT